MYNSNWFRKLKEAAPVDLRHNMKHALVSFNSLTADWRQPPSVFIAGIKKGGTTSLYNHLITHPAVGVNVQKEPHYFDLYFHKGERWYLGNFPFRKPASEQQLVIDSSPDYLYSMEAMQRINAFCPQAKIILLLRNPLTRSYSEYQYGVKLLYQKRAPTPFDVRIEHELKWVPENLHRFTEPGFHVLVKKKSPFLGLGLYVVFLREWLKTFPREQFYITTSERFFENTADVVNEITAFLGLPPHRYTGLQKHNVNKYQWEVDEALTTRIRALQEPFNRELEELLGMKTGW